MTALSAAAAATLDVVGGTKNATIEGNITNVDAGGQPIDPDLAAKAKEIAKELNQQVWSQSLLLLTTQYQERNM